MAYISNKIPGQQIRLTSDIARATGCTRIHASFNSPCPFLVDLSMNYNGAQWEESTEVDDANTTKKKDSPDELSVVPRWCGLFNSLHGSPRGSVEFDHFNTVFIGMWASRNKIIHDSGPISEDLIWLKGPENTNIGHRAPIIPINVWSQNLPKPPIFVRTKFSEFGHFCPKSPDLPAGRPNLSEHRFYQALPLLTRHLPLHGDSQLPQLVRKFSLGQGALSERGPDLHALASLFVRTWIWLASPQLAILSVRTPTSGTKMSQICPILPQTFIGITNITPHIVRTHILSSWISSIDFDPGTLILYICTLLYVMNIL